ncbi:glycosyltransferase family 87 protein [Halobacterium yunchengense]|uniref:glycosyltransferase family 87 protein n=1 Tax=Halobacterium yunchengense TaxID=3108497 RepID=UPI00300933CA
MSPGRGPRFVLAAGALAGLANTALFPLRNPEQVALASDVYYHAARAALRGADVYAVTPVGEAGFRYPPVVALAFFPHALLGSPLAAFALQTALNLAALGALAVLLVRAVERGGVALSRTDRALVAAFAFLAGPVGVNLVNGQVNPPLALALAAGALFLEADRDRASGVLFGLAALVKVFPALVGVWLLRQRRWRAVAAATATGVLGLAAGLVVFGPGASATWVTDVLASESAVASFAGGPDPGAPYSTVRRQLAFALPGLPADWLLPVGAAVLAPVFAGANRVVADYRSRLVALAGTLHATLLLLPLEPFYAALAVFPTVPLLYLLREGLPRRLLLAGSLLVYVPVTWTSVTTVAAVLPAAAAEPLTAAASAGFGFVLPPTVGVWLVLAGCLLAQHRAASRTAPDA